MIGALDLAEAGTVRRFVEKPRGDGGRSNGGFFVLSPKVLSLIKGDETPFEAAPLTELAATGELKAYQHDGFWQPMDTLRDKNQLEQMWAGGKAAWQVWDRAPAHS